MEVAPLNENSGVAADRLNTPVIFPVGFPTTTKATDDGVSSEGERSSIQSLEHLFAEILRILHNRDNPERLRQCQTALESYKGSDWILHSATPESRKNQVYGYSRVHFQTQPDLFTLLILTWSPRSESALHSHPCERCFLMPLQGELWERRFAVHEEHVAEGLPEIFNGQEGLVPPTSEISLERIPLHKAAWIDDSIGWHQIINRSPGLSVSLHLYVPAFSMCKIIDPLTRHIKLVRCFARPAENRNSLHEAIFAEAGDYMKSLDCPASRPVIKLRSRKAIEDIFDEKCPLRLNHNDPPCDDETVMDAVKKTCDFSTNTGHLFFFNQLFARSEPVATAADCLATCLNANLNSYETAPVFLMMEWCLLEHLASFLGWCKTGQRQLESATHRLLPGENLGSPEMLRAHTDSVTYEGMATGHCEANGDAEKSSTPAISRVISPVSEGLMDRRVSDDESTLASQVSRQHRTYRLTGKRYNTLESSRALSRLGGFLWKSSTPRMFDGVMTPGASIANFTAITCAMRARFGETVTLEGHHALPRLAIFTSRQGHISIYRASALAGLGIRSIFPVAVTEDNGAMDTVDLQRQIAQAKQDGRLPFLVCCTAGTTVAGAFDPFEELSKVCKKESMWMHVDGSSGASFLLVREEPYSLLCRGMELADSITWNLHKLLGVPMQCTAFLTRHPNILAKTHTCRSTANEEERGVHSREHEMEAKSMQCGRRADSFKIWCLWKKLGDQGMANRIRLIHTHAREFASLLHNFPMKLFVPGKDLNLPTRVITTEAPLEGQPKDANERAFALVWQPISTTVSFWWIPYDVRDLFWDTQKGGYRNPIVAEALALTAPIIREAMMLEGSLMIEYHTFEDRPSFWRLPLVNPVLSREDLFNVLRIINRLGASRLPPGSFTFNDGSAGLKRQKNPLTHHVARYPNPELSEEIESLRVNAELPPLNSYAA